MKKTLLLLTLLVAAAMPAFAYDAPLAAKAAEMFGRLDRQTLTTSPCKVAPDVVLKWLKDGEKVTLIDIRTPEEAGVVGLTGKNALAIPLNVLFQPENLKRIPTEGKVVIVCHSGFRAGAATAVLQLIGVQNAIAMTGGIADLTRLLTPVTAP